MRVSLIQNRPVMRLSILFYVLICLTFSSCSNAPEPSQAEEIVDLSNAPNSAKKSKNWPGTYSGVIPCADCEGIRLKIVLDQSEHFMVERQYAGESAKVEQSKGQIFWDKNGQDIRLNGIGDDNGSLGFRIEDGAIRKLDLYGKKIEGQLAEKYLLTKENNDIKNKYWQAIEMDGHPLVINSQAKNLLHLVIDDTKVTGFAGCNRFSGTYQSSTQDQISFNPLLSTKMTCDQQDKEDLFLKLLNRVDHYKVNGGILTLNDKDDKRLLRFKYNFFKSPILD